MADNYANEVPNWAEARARERFNLHKVSWGAMWAGVMVTIGMEALFLSFGIFIDAVFGGSTIWRMAWYLVTMGVSLLVGAWCTGRLSDASIRETSTLHGLAMWGLATLATVLIAFVAVRWGITYITGAPTGAAVESEALWGQTEQPTRTAR